MKQNEGTVDRVIRVIVGIIVAVVGIVYHSWWGLLALIPLLTAATGVCLLYLPFRISTRGKAAAK
ncbi:MAG TPA: DUF2892 domain-containing protein [Rectinemataceae bacterium]|nr:DUF2892 domain-containing protein [Rectinemataceae bacterium]